MGQLRWRYIRSWHTRTTSIKTPWFFAYFHGSIDCLITWRCVKYQIEAPPQVREREHKMVPCALGSHNQLCSSRWLSYVRSMTRLNKYTKSRSFVHEWIWQVCGFHGGAQQKEVQTGGTWKQGIIHGGLFLLSACTSLIDLSNNILLCAWNLEKNIFLLVKQSIEQQNERGS